MNQTKSCPLKKREAATKAPARWRRGFVEASPSRVLRDGEGTFRVTVIDASQILEMGVHVEYFGSFERISE
jgi:hypothetical protein